MRIVSSYAPFFALFFLLLSAHVIRVRTRAQVAIGVGDDTALLRATRVHANFAEYVPFTLLLIALAEVQGSAHWFIHVACVVLLLGRVVHAFGMSRVDEDFRYRMVGIGCTYTVMACTAFALLVASWTR